MRASISASLLAASLLAASLLAASESASPLCGAAAGFNGCTFYSSGKFVSFLAFSASGSASLLAVSASFVALLGLTDAHL